MWRQAFLTVPAFNIASDELPTSSVDLRVGGGFAPRRRMACGRGPTSGVLLDLLPSAPGTGTTKASQDCLPIATVKLPSDQKARDLVYGVVQQH